MADIVLTTKQLEDIFQALTVTLTGLNNDSGVRVSWPTAGAPGWKIDEDIAFIRVTPANDPFAQQVETEYLPGQNPNLDTEKSYSRVYQVQWILYGPNSSDYADLLRSGLFKESTKSTLKVNNLYMITDVPVPQRMPELFNGRWWERADLSARFNEFVVRKSTVPTLESANITVVTDSGHEEVI